jgi:hypothetical protein
MTASSSRRRRLEPILKAAIIVAHVELVERTRPGRNFSSFRNAAYI